MDQEHEWGPWIAHDGKGLPAPVGTMVERRFNAPVEMICGEWVEPTLEVAEPLKADELESWLWCLPRHQPIGEIARVVEYRVRKSASFEMLKQLVEGCRPVERHAKEPETCR